MKRALGMALATALFFGVRAEAAEDLVSGVSTDLIQIQSDFAGTEIVVFGAIETFDPTTPVEDRDIVVAVRGPDVDFTVQRKARILGLWINAEQLMLTGMPGYYFVSSTRPLEVVASADTLERFELGTAHLRAEVPTGTPTADLAEFHTAAERLLKREGMYWESTTAIEFLSRSLFRARIPVPANVPPGEYRAEVYLFHGGTVTSAQSSPLFVDKTGLEREIYDFSFEAPLAYGSLAVFLAMSFGWLGFALFRQRM
jgi:uncharacterized protein (TIGR02186 family)